MSEPFDPAPAASLLAAHWRNGTQLTELPPEIRPRTLHEGYDVQDRLIAEMGEEVSGWKLTRLRGFDPRRKNFCDAGR
jgi:2-keto-4-pentenoate hydratase